MKRFIFLRSASATLHRPTSTPEESLEMAMSKCMKESGDESTSRKINIKIKGRNVNRLPDDILVEILKRVPDAFLRYRVKYVCRRWFKIITNRILLDHESYILHNPSRRVRLVDIWEEGQLGLQVKEQSLEIDPPGTIQCWCNEFLLMTCPFGLTSMCVFNLITKEEVYLPECTTTSCGGHKYCTCGLALYYDRFKGKYKVVHLFIGPSSGCEIFVLGDSLEWKMIQVPYTIRDDLMWAYPVEVQGRYLNWKIHKSNSLVCVDMVEEVVCKIRLPVSLSPDRVGNIVSFYEMDGVLAFFDGVTQDKAQIWVRKDLSRKKKWKKLRSITVSNSYFEKYPHKMKFFKLRGMISKRYAIMDSSLENGMYSYDLKDGVMKRLDIDIQRSCVRRVVRSSAPRYLKSKPKITSRKSNNMKEEGGGIA